MVFAFEQGVAPGPFCDSRIKNSEENFYKIRRRAVAHINAQEAVVARNNGPHSRLAKPKEASKPSRPLRVNEASTGKKEEVRHAPYRKGSLRQEAKKRIFVQTSAYRTRN